MQSQAAMHGRGHPLKYHALHGLWKSTTTPDGSERCQVRSGHHRNTEHFKVGPASNPRGGVWGLDAGWIAAAFGARASVTSVTFARSIFLTHLFIFGACITRYSAQETPDWLYEDKDSSNGGCESIRGEGSVWSVKQYDTYVVIADMALNVLYGRPGRVQGAAAAIFCRGRRYARTWGSSFLHLRSSYPRANVNDHLCEAARGSVGGHWRRGPRQHVEPAVWLESCAECSFAWSGSYSESPMTNDRIRPPRHQRVG